MTSFKSVLSITFYFIKFMKFRLKTIFRVVICSDSVAIIKKKYLICLILKLRTKALVDCRVKSFNNTFLNQIILK